MKHLHANYKYSLTSHQQQAIQLFLRLVVPKEAQHSAAFELLHNLTYAESWTEEPEYRIAEPQFVLEMQAQADKAMEELLEARDASARRAWAGKVQ